MKIVSFKQNTKQWREWRGKGLGASDAPVYMGDSPWTTPFELWLQKTELMERPPANEFAVAAMKRGTELEPLARKLIEKQSGTLFEDVAATHDEYEFLRASFDGYNEKENMILEIKCPGKIDHEKAVKGNVPSKYKAQIQMQLLISKAKQCVYFSWDGVSNHGVSISVLPDPEYHATLLSKAIDFWACVQSRTLPDVSTEEVAKLVKNQQAYLEKASKISFVLGLLTENKEK